MFRVKTNSIPEILQIIFKVVEHNYSTKYSEYSFKEPNIFCRVTKFSISSCGPRLRNKHTDKLLKTRNSFPFFTDKIKDRLIKLKTISIYFQSWFEHSLCLDTGIIWVAYFNYFIGFSILQRSVHQWVVKYLIICKC